MHNKPKLGGMLFGSAGVTDPVLKKSNTIINQNAKLNLRRVSKQIDESINEETSSGKDGKKSHHHHRKKFKNTKKYIPTK
jgi:hypothetical protein